MLRTGVRSESLGQGPWEFSKGHDGRLVGPFEYSDVEIQFIVKGRLFEEGQEQSAPTGTIAMLECHHGAISTNVPRGKHLVCIAVVM